MEYQSLSDHYQIFNFDEEMRAFIIDWYIYLKEIHKKYIEKIKPYKNTKNNLVVVR